MLSEDVEKINRGDHYDYYPEPGKPRPPLKMTPAAVQKIAEGYGMGLNNREAALYGGVSLSTLSNYLRDHPKFRERRDLLRDNPRMKAKIALFKNLKEDNPKLCLDVLERIAPDEFSKKVQVDKTITNVYLTDEQMREQILSLSKELGLIVEGEFEEVKLIEDK